MTVAKKNAFYELAIEKANKQAVMVDALTEESPILAALPMEATTDGLKNVYEEVVAIDAAEAVDYDAALSELNADTKLEESTLSKFGGKMTIGEDKANAFGGPASYFGKRMPLILRETGSAIEKSIIYNNIRAYAFAQGKLVNAGGDQNANYSILAVKWSPGETTGLYDPAGFGNGKVFDIMPINGGNLYEIDSDGVLGYGQRLATYFGIQLANPRYVAGIANIDPAIADDAAMVTEAQMDQLLLNVRANPANTAIYMHPAMLTELYRYKSSKLQMFIQDGDVNRRIDMWNGIPIITSYNFLPKTETNVVFA